MILVRRVVAVACFVALAAVGSGAFTLANHADITRNALAELVKQPQTLAAFVKRVPPDAQDMARKGFTSAAVQEIVDGNKAMDAGDCGKRGVNDPATPCSDPSEERASLLRLLRNDAPKAEHFDAEKIQEGSNRIFDTIATIRRHLQQGEFVAARKELGGALHSLQDFYAHTNWVELEHQRPDGRVGLEPDAFNTVGENQPRIARANEPTCVGGVRLITDLTFEERQAFLTKYPASVLGDALVDRPLTSGYFFIWGSPAPPTTTDRSLDNLEALYKAGRIKDSADITERDKCRHGYVVKGVVLTQPGINKDDAWPDDIRTLSRRRGYDNANALAQLHSSNFVVRLFTLFQKDPTYVDMMLGLMGYEPTAVIDGFSILQVPRPPPRQTTWDGILEVGLNIWAVHPDIVACVSSDDGRRICADECKDADTGNPARRCTQPLGPRGFRLPLTGSIRLEVWDMDPTSRQGMAAAEIPVSHPCLKYASAQPCEIVSPDRGSLVISFNLPPEGAPGRAPAPPPAPNGPSPPPPPPARVPTLEEIDAGLGLRDADNCTGADTFFPQGTAFASSALGRQLGQDRANQLYQMAAFATAIPDQKIKQAVLSAIQSRVGDDAYLGAMAQVVVDIQQSQALARAYQTAAGDLAQRIASNGLNQLLPSSPPATSLAPSVGSWILKRLNTPERVSQTLDLMSAGPQAISAECALNQLAREGFTDTINGR